jgi:hypothetical protein
LDFELPIIAKYFNKEAIVEAIAEHDRTCPPSKVSGRTRVILDHMNVLNRTLRFHDAHPACTTYRAVRDAMLVAGFEWREQPSPFNVAYMTARIEGTTADVGLVMESTHRPFPTFKKRPFKSISSGICMRMDDCTAEEAARILAKIKNAI